MGRQRNAPLKHLTRRGAGELGSPQGCAINVVPGSQAKSDLHILGGSIWATSPSSQLPFSNDGARARLGGRGRNVTSPARLALAARSPNKARGISGEEFVHLQHLELEEMALSDLRLLGT